MSWRRWLAGGTGLVALIAATLYWLALPPENVTMVSWGEDYQQAQMVSFVHPFADRTGVDVDVVTYGGGLDEIRAQVTSGEVVWDIVDFDLADAAAACREGLLEEIDHADLPPGSDDTAAISDFVPGALGRCWVGSVVYSQVIAFAPDMANGVADAPSTAADFFDLARFPGKRGLRDTGPEYTLPFALLADRVAPEDLYSLLATEAGIARSLAKLDTIKDEILWWRQTNQPIDWLANGEVAMTTALNGRVYDAVQSGQDIAALWDGQLYGLDVFGIPKGTPNRARTLEFLRFATSADSLAEQAARLPFGPARVSALPLIGPNPRTGSDMLAFLPTAPENFRNAALVDPDWWAAHGDAIAARWNAWRGR